MLDSNALEPLLATEVGRMYLQVADYSEGTLEPEEALAIAENIIMGKHPLRNRVDLLLRGHTRTWWQAQAIREELKRTSIDFF